MEKQLEAIKRILNNRNSLKTCTHCDFQWLPIGAKFQDECPKCSNRVSDGSHEHLDLIVGDASSIALFDEIDLDFSGVKE